MPTSALMVQWFGHASQLTVRLRWLLGTAGTFKGAQK